eukprot:999630-Rhodomonas_salina.5
MPYAHRSTALHSMPYAHRSTAQHSMPYAHRSTAQRSMPDAHAAGHEVLEVADAPLYPPTQQLRRPYPSSVPDSG